MNLGDEVTFGKYKWNIIATQDNKMLLLCANPLKLTYYHKMAKPVYWEKSAARQYLNEKFIRKFSEEDKKRIVSVANKNTKNFMFDKEIEVEFDDTTDNFFLLSLDDIALYFGGFENFSALYDAAEPLDGVFGTNESVAARGGRIGGTRLKLKKISNVQVKSIKYGFFKKNFREGLVPPELLKLTKGSKNYSWWLRSNGVNALSAAHVDKGGFVDFYGTFVGYKFCVYRPAVWVLI